MINHYLLKEKIWIIHQLIVKEVLLKIKNKNKNNFRNKLWILICYLLVGINHLRLILKLIILGILSRIFGKQDSRTSFKPRERKVGREKSQQPPTCLICSIKSLWIKLVISDFQSDLLYGTTISNRLLWAVFTSRGVSLPSWAALRDSL